MPNAPSYGRQSTTRTGRISTSVPIQGGAGTLFRRRPDGRVEPIAEVENVDLRQAPSRWGDPSNSSPMEDLRAMWSMYNPVPEPVPEPPGEIPLSLHEEDAYPPTVAIITKGFGTKGRMFEEGFKVEILMVVDDPTKEDRRSILIRVIDRRAPDTAYGAVACVSSHRLKLVG